ncbi:MAG: hypothetical protein ACREVE_04730 [Gammaproteobacteria bacterium]
MRAAAFTASAFFLVATPAMSVEIDGTVRDASGSNATVVTQSDLIPNIGDEVEIFFKMPTGGEITVGTARVSDVGADAIEVTIQEASGSVAKGQLVRIYSDSPTKKGAAAVLGAAQREAVAPSREGEMRSPVIKSADIDTDCRADLRSLGAAMLAYRVIHDDKNPTKLSDLYYDGLVESLGDFTCVAAGAETASEIDAKTDYTLEPLPDVQDLLVREKAPREGANEVLAIFADGSIKPVAVAGAPTIGPAVTKTQPPAAAIDLPPTQRAPVEQPPTTPPAVASPQSAEPPAPPMAQPGSEPAPSAGAVISVQTATYGENCGAPVNNVTDHAKQACDGKAGCDYRVDGTIIGDPAPGCAKDYVIGWTCDAEQQVHYLNAAPEAGLGSVLRLSCPPPAGAVAGPVPPGMTTPDQPPVAGKPTRPVVVTRQRSAPLPPPPDEYGQRGEHLRSPAITNRVSANPVVQAAAGLDQARAALDDLIAQNPSLANQLRTIEAGLAEAERQLDLGLTLSARTTARDALRYASDYGRDVFKLHSLKQAEQQAKELSAHSPGYRKLLKAIQAQTAQRDQAAEENFARYVEVIVELSEADSTHREQALSDLGASGLTEQAQAALALIRDQLAHYQRTRRAEPDRWRLAFQERFETLAD